MEEAQAALARVERGLYAMSLRIAQVDRDKDETEAEAEAGLEQEDDGMEDMGRVLEEHVSVLETRILPTLPPGRDKEQTEYLLFKHKQRYGDLRAWYRSGKMARKKKTLESLYIRSFDRRELQIRSGATETVETDELQHPEREVAGPQGPSSDQQLEELTAQERLLRQNTLLTDKLQNVNALMKSSLLAGEMNLNELEISTSSLADLSNSYAFFGDVLNRTNSLVKSINKASKNERAMIYRSLYFFVSVCCWILWRRIFKRPVLLLLWVVLSPLKLLLWTRAGNTPAPAISSSIEILSSQNIATALSTVTDIVEEFVTRDEL